MPEDSSATCPCANISCVCEVFHSKWLNISNPANNPVSNAQRLFIFPILFLVGIAGNMLNLLCLNSRTMRSRTTLFLSAMAVADMLFFVAMLPDSLMAHFDLVHSVTFYKFFMTMHPTLIALANTLSTASIWFAVAVSVERLMAVVMPLHARFYVTKTRICAAIATICVLSTPVHIYQIVWRMPQRLDVCDRTCRITDYTYKHISAAHPMYINVSANIATAVTIWIPFFLLIVLNCCLIYSLKMSEKKQSQLVEVRKTSDSKSRAAERKITYMVVVMLSSFLLWNTLSGFVSIIMASKAGQPGHEWVALVSTLANILVMTGKATNFLLYCCSSERFRKSVQRLFTRKKKRKDSLINSSIARDRESTMMVHLPRSRDSLSNGSGPSTGLMPKKKGCQISGSDPDDSRRESNFLLEPNDSATNNIAASMESITGLRKLEKRLD